MIQETLDKANVDNNDKTDFFVIACEKKEETATEVIEGEGYNGRYDYLLFGSTNNYQGYKTGVGTPAETCCIEFADLPTGFSIQTGHLLEYYSDTTKEIQIKINYTIKGNNFPQAIYEAYPVGCTYYKVSESAVIGEDRVYEVVYKLLLTAEQTCYIDFKAVVDLVFQRPDDIIVDGGWALVSEMNLSVSEPDHYEVYNDITSITDFDGDETTIYNLPLTPKRAVLKHLPYISISTYGSDNDIVFETSDRVSNPVCQLGYETNAITENADVEPATPLFLPIRFTFDTQEEHNIFYDMYDKKYGYYTITHEKSKKQVEGWVNKAIFAVSRRKQQSWELQAKTL